MKNSLLNSIRLTAQYVFLPWSLIHKYEYVMRGVVKAEYYATFLAIFNGNRREDMCIALMSKRVYEEFKKTEADVVPFETKASNEAKKLTLVKKEDK